MKAKTIIARLNNRPKVRLAGRRSAIPPLNKKISHISHRINSQRRLLSPSLSTYSKKNLPSKRRFKFQSSLPKKKNILFKAKLLSDLINQRMANRTFLSFSKECLAELCQIENEQSDRFAQNQRVIPYLTHL